jgi:preprotein translocase subunit SecE
MQMALKEQIEKARDVVPRSLTFLQEVWAELKKVYWPTRKEVTAATLVVVSVVVVISFFLGVVDLGLTRVVQLVLKRS